MQKHVIVGAGASGVAAALLLAESGDEVRLVTRSGRGPVHPGIELVAADATDAARMTELTAGASTLFNCAMPLYYRWPTDFPPLNTALLTAAERTGAGYVILGNAYGYGPVEGPATEDLPMAPTTVKGRVRAEMWEEALAAHEAGRARATEVRAIDFVGRDAYSIFTLMIAPQVLAGDPAIVPADLDAPHSWSYIGDVARTLVAAAKNEQSWGRAWHVPSTATVSVRELTTRFAEVAGAPAPELVRMSEEDLLAAAAADPVVNEFPEMQYMYQEPFVLDSTETEQALDLKPTPLDDALIENAGGARATG
ncbi:NAD-dependent epimerase/dehydratase family protein [Actinomadura roseirufa]|uniref:NAD-dependent epimerase/dehydratase family protein n=1 Tax=Actinomadura roseirufa TaxID=2094049 RepID=UPI001041B77E|nr:NAD-dependent epimerase/dehydratase family protein [Actinomadura roseirufa]